MTAAGLEMAHAPDGRGAPRRDEWDPPSKGQTMYVMRAVALACWLAGVLWMTAEAGEAFEVTIDLGSGAPG